MTKILIGVIVALVLGLGVQTWRASSAGNLAAVYAETNQALTRAVETQNRSAGLQTQRFEDFDASMARLNAGQLLANANLLQALAALEDFKPQPGDSDETVRCARLPVPLDLDRQLR